MTTMAIKQELHNYLEVADSKKLKAIYTMVEDDIHNLEHPAEYSTAFKAELDKRYADYKSGKAKMVTPVEMKKRIQKILKSGKQK
jgi:putative addiction module component (TIGR02574 family)